MNGNLPQFEHERYEELCALATAGALTPQESEELSVHLASCAECRDIFAQYEALATEGLPALAGRYDPIPIASRSPFDDISGLGRLMQTVESQNPHPLSFPSMRIQSSLLRGLIAASLFFGVAFASYRAGERRRMPSAVGALIHTPPSAVVTSQLTAEKQGLSAALAVDRARLSEMEQQVATSKVETKKLRADIKDAQDRLDAITDASATVKNQSDAQVSLLTQERDATAAKLKEAQASYQTVQYELDTLRNQHKQDLLHLASLDEKVTSLNAALDETEKHAKKDEQYLASDKDVRDLIGARNLYIADIMDVDQAGHSRKPFGRVFYTKTKSLIFYAYDLDREQGIKLASTFQVWGRTGANDRKPINLGMLYMDSETNKRWTLRVDNAQQLAQLDSIFVTAEPKPKADKPSGKPFLYASLRRDANHP
jgi:hypothetical protein